MQEKEVKNGALTIEGYYATLSKKEKSNKAPKKRICRVQCYLTSKDTPVGKHT